MPTRPPSPSDFDTIIEAGVLSCNEDVAWREKVENKDHWLAELEVLGADVPFPFMLRITANKWIPSDYSISLVCASVIQVRRLDVGHDHANPSGCEYRGKIVGPHMHILTEYHEHHCAVPITGDSSDDCQVWFERFLKETNIVFNGQWRNFPETQTKFIGW